MIFVKTSKLKPNMIVAQSLNHPCSPVPLLIESTPLAERHIKKLKLLDIPGIYIHSKHSEDIVAESFLNDELKKEVTQELKNIHREFICSSSVTPKMADTLLNVSSKIMDSILSQDKLVMNMLEVKSFDDYTYSHSINVAVLSSLIGIQLGYSKLSLKELTSAGLMHDLGKLDLPISLIHKTSPLTDSEFEIIKTHPMKAVDKLKYSMKISMTILDGIATHHEKFDGSGYPFGLSGSDIPLCGKIIAVADVYDALTSSRVYRPAWSVKDTVDYMKSLSGIHFDPDILAFFLPTIAIYPIGTMVKLEDDSLALVVKYNTIKNQPNTNKPVIRILESNNYKINDEFDLLTSDDIKIIKGLSVDEELPDSIFKV